VRIPLLLLCLTASACTTAGSAWVREGFGSGTHTGEWDDETPPRLTAIDTTTGRRASSLQSRTLGVHTSADDPMSSDDEATPAPTRVSASGNARAHKRNRPLGPFQGRVLGTFRNTYYDFPSERDFSGEKVTLHGSQCKAIAQVARGFYEAVCVQGSGLLANGTPVSFHRRNCECAEICPRTQQRICFDALELARFPWGRGATGGAITPLLTVAVDSNVIPLGTPLYIPEYDGLPRDPARSSLHDGCFVAQDRGLRVQGQHVDLFTGQTGMTQLWNGLVPSNGGVTVVIDNPKWARAIP
jgi:3D (Asp-Asp-Asp) domain-containing protein